MNILRRFWPLFTIVLLWAFFSFPYWGKGRVPFPATYLVTFFAPWSATYGMPVKNNAMPDVITQIYPWKHLTIASWKAGEIPLWNPYSFSGTAQAGNYQTAVFSPFNALFLILPEVHAWSVMILLQPLLAGLFMYLYLGAVGRGRAGRIMGSFAFMFSGFITVWMAYGTLGYAVLFLPLILFAVEAYRAGRSSWALPLISAGLAGSFVSGHLQMSLYVAGLSAAYGIYRLWATPIRRRIGFFVFFAFGLFLAAPQLLLSYDVFLASGRSSGVSRGEIIPWQYLVTLFAPDFYGNPVTRNDWFGHYAEWASFIGVVPLLLAWTAAWKLFRDSVVRFFAVAAVLVLLLATPSPVNELIYFFRIPVLSNSSASRIIVLFSFSLAVLSAYGFDGLLVAWKKEKFASYARIWAAVASAVAAVWGVLLFLNALPPDKRSIAMHNMVLPTVLLVAGLSLVSLGFVRRGKYALICIALLLAAAGFDTVRFAVKWMPFDPAVYVYPPKPVLTKIRQLTAGNYARVIGNIGNEVGSYFGIQLLEGYDAVYQSRYGRFVSAISTGVPALPQRSVVSFDKHGLYSERILELLGVRYYLHKKSDARFPWAYPFWEYPQYRLVWEDDNFQILENPSGFPRAFLASSYRVVRGDQEILDAVFSPATGLQDTVILEKEPDGKPATGAGSVRILRYSANRIAMDTASRVPKLLFLSDVYDPGWKATVDGKPAPILRADYDFRAVYVPAGTHKVEMVFIPRSMTIGGIFVGFATLGCIVWYARVSGRRRRTGKTS